VPRKIAKSEDDTVNDTTMDVQKETAENEVFMNLEAPTSVPFKMVKVKTSVNHRCSIGGEWYDFVAGKCYNVPESVKKTLLKAGILAPL
jgi:uncharacterized protein YaiE (UPF0345 family)